MLPHIKIADTEQGEALVEAIIKERERAKLGEDKDEQLALTRSLSQFGITEYDVWFDEYGIMQVEFEYQHPE